MTIENDQDLDYSRQLLERMRAHRDKCAVETIWHPSLRDAMVESAEAQIRKTERDIAEYVARREARVA